MKKEVLNYSLLLLMLISACAEEENIDQQGEDPVESSESLFVKPLKDYEPTVRKLLAPDSNVLRGAAFDMKREHVRDLEESQHIETTEEYINYGIDFGLKESADILYYFDSTEVLNRIELVVYTDRKQRRDSLFKLFFYYFKDRYDVAEQSDTTIVFDNHHQVLLSKTGSQKYPNIEIIAKPE